MNAQIEDVVTDPQPAWQLLRQMCSELGLTQVDLAQKTGYTPKHINQVMRGMCGISVAVAVDLELALDREGVAEELLVAQTTYDLWRRRRLLAAG